MCKEHLLKQTSKMAVALNKERNSFSSRSRPNFILSNAIIICLTQTTNMAVALKIDRSDSIFHHISLKQTTKLAVALNQDRSSFSYRHFSPHSGQ